MRVLLGETPPTYDHLRWHSTKNTPPRPSTEPPAGPSIAPAHGACKWANGRESLTDGQDQ